MLYLVSTPIGNLEDMTFRALSTLKAVSAVYCEDTRRTRALMTHFGVSKPLVRYQDRRERETEALLERLRRGEDVALVSDGGLPCVSDPGRDIVARARRENIPVTVLPGANAASTAAAGSGFPADSFVFLGFLPRSPGKRRKSLASAAALGRTIVVYESPFRVRDLLALAAEALGPHTRACVARELSKVHEEWLSGTVAQLSETLGARKEILGEFVVMFHPAAPNV